MSSIPASTVRTPLNTFPDFVGYFDRRNDIASLHRSKHRRMYESRRRLPTSHSFRGLHRLHVPRRNVRPGRLRHAHVKDNELGNRLWPHPPVGSCQRQAVRPSAFLTWMVLIFRAQYDSTDDRLRGSVDRILVHRPRVSPSPQSLRPHPWVDLHRRCLLYQPSPAVVLSVRRSDAVSSFRYH